MHFLLKKQFEFIVLNLSKLELFLVLRKVLLFKREKRKSRRFKTLVQHIKTVVAL